jgi:hypothetical protein
MSKELTKAVKEKRQQILDFEETLLSMQDDDNVYLGNNHKHPLQHAFAEGIYLRELRLEAGTTVVGKIHKEDHIVFLLHGIVAVATDNGVEEYEGPCYMKSSAGVKRIAHAVTDIIWVNIHANPSNTQDVEELENNIVAKDYLEYEKYKKLK